eukprot:1381690-Rhodomonas_salina.7
MEEGRRWKQVAYDPMRLVSDVRHDPTRLLCDVRYGNRLCAATGPTRSLWEVRRHGKSGTEHGYCCTRCPVLNMGIFVPGGRDVEGRGEGEGGAHGYAKVRRVSGANTAYGAILCGVLMRRLVICDAGY